MNLVKVTFVRFLGNLSKYLPLPPNTRYIKAKEGHNFQSPFNCKKLLTSKTQGSHYGSQFSSVECEFAVVSPSYVKVVGQVILQRRSPSCQDGFSLRPGLQILHSVHHMSRRPVYHPISWTNVKVLSPAILPLSRKPFCARVFKVLLIPYSNNVLTILCRWCQSAYVTFALTALLLLHCIGSAVGCEGVAAFRSWLFWFFLVSSTVVLLLLLFLLFFHFVVCGVGCEGVQVAVVQENDNQLTTLPNTQTPFIIFFKFLLLLFSYSCCRCLHIVVLPIFPAGVSFHLR